MMPTMHRLCGATCERVAAARRDARGGRRCIQMGECVVVEARVQRFGRFEGGCGGGVKRRCGGFKAVKLRK